MKQTRTRQQKGGQDAKQQSQQQVPPQSSQQQRATSVLGTPQVGTQQIVLENWPTDESTLASQELTVQPKLPQSTSPSQSVQQFEDETNSMIDVGGMKPVVWKKQPAAQKGEPPLSIIVNTAQPAQIIVPQAASSIIGWIGSAINSILAWRASCGTTKYAPWELIHPSNKCSPTGKYDVKLCWCGVWKKVVVDDRLPFGEAGEPILVHSSFRTELWQSILSKAILKLLTGKCHPIMKHELFLIHVLTGAVPEQLAINTQQQIPWETTRAILSSKEAILIGIPRLESQAAIAAANYKLVTVLNADTIEGKNSIQISNSNASDQQLCWLSEVAFWKSFSLHVYRFCDNFPNPSFVDQEVQQKPIQHAILFDSDNETKLIVCAFVVPTVAQVIKAISKTPHEANGAWTLEPIDWSSPFSSPQTALTIKGTNMVAGELLIPPGKRAYLIKTDCIWASKIAFWADHQFQTIEDAAKVIPEKFGITTLTFDGMYKSPEPFSWTVWFRYLVTVKSPLILFAKLNVPDETARQFCSLKLINNDTLEEYPTFSNSTLPVNLQPNVFGYTVFVDFKAPIKVASGTYQLQISSSSQDISVEQDPAKHIHEHEEVSVVDKNSSVLFRHVIKPTANTVGSFHLSLQNTSWQNCRIPVVSMQVLDNGTLITECKGLGSATLPHVKLIKAPKEEETSHKYIVQATITEGPQVPFMKPIASTEHTDLSPRATSANRKQPSKQRVGNKAMPVSNQPQRVPSPSLRPDDAQSQQSQSQSQLLPAQQQQPNSILEHPLSWRFKIFSGMPVEGRKDTDQEERLALIKSKWEETPGTTKYQKAQTAREKLVEVMKTNPANPIREVGIMSRNVVTFEELTKQLEQKRKENAENIHRREVVLALGEQGKELANKAREDFERQMKEMNANANAIRAEQHQWRESFNKAQQEAAAAVALALKQQQEQQLLLEQQKLQQVEQQQQQQQQLQQQASSPTTPSNQPATPHSTENTSKASQGQRRKRS